MSTETTNPSDKLYSPKEVAARLGVSIRTLRRMTSAGEISFVRHGNKSGRPRFGESHIAEYLRERTVGKKGMVSAFVQLAGFSQKALKK